MMNYESERRYMASGLECMYNLLESIVSIRQTVMVKSSIHLVHKTLEYGDDLTPNDHLVVTPQLHPFSSPGSEPF